ncbi:hypothetical protein RRG08_021029 [Elysia crispata]|uniref:Uncharacterized protein n=1 Tax=Elysia crispata TaxID=231223 RepID=A0AAE1DLY2_9GAST|nr:hypothetical protein RRG08_021029 [Elysia crispata]
MMLGECVIEQPALSSRLECLSSQPAPATYRHTLPRILHVLPSLSSVAGWLAAVLGRGHSRQVLFLSSGHLEGRAFQDARSKTTVGGIVKRGGKISIQMPSPKVGMGRRREEEREFHTSSTDQSFGEHLLWTRARNGDTRQRFFCMDFGFKLFRSQTDTNPTAYQCGAHQTDLK